MTTSQTPFLSEILKGGRIPENKLGYFRARLTNRIHELVLTIFLELEKKNEISRAELARRLGKKPEQITRWLGAPGNWEFETFSDLLLGMGYEPGLSAISLKEIKPAESERLAGHGRHEITIEITESLPPIGAQAANDPQVKPGGLLTPAGQTRREVQRTPALA